MNITLVVVYRLPSSGTEVFCDQFPQYLDQVVIKSQKLIVLGDFNFHYECVNDSATTKFRGLLDSLGLIQHVSSPTPKAGHTLDLVITHANEHLVNNRSVLDKLISDHHAVPSTVPYNRPSIGKKINSFRKYKTVDLLALKHDVAQSALCAAPASTATESAFQYHHVLSATLNKHAPMKIKLVSDRAGAPWFNNGIRDARARRRKAER